MTDVSRRKAAKLLSGALLAGLPPVRDAQALGASLGQGTAQPPSPAGTARARARSAPAAQNTQTQQPTPPASTDDATAPDDATPADGLAIEDENFLVELQQRGILYFVEQADPHTGQVLDRATNRGTGARDTRTTASIAATGFGLTALCIAHREGLYPSDQIQQRVRATLDFHLNHMQHEHGFFYHFNHVTTGRPLSWSEVSSIDTAILLCGVLTCRAYFSDARIKDLATQIYDRVEWPWMLNGGTTFSMGWLPASGFISTRWDHYCELMMLYLLAIGSTSHPVPPATWDAWTRPALKFQRFEYIAGHDPLFVHQYSHAWFDFARQRDNYANYFQNSVVATNAHRAFLKTLKRGYTDDYWGITASDWQHGYTAWGGPPLMGPVDGSVVPCAAAGSLPFTPTECLQTLRSQYTLFGNNAWGRYGFCDAYHPDQLWYDPDCLGIDVGIGVLMAENLRTGFVWETFMRNPEPAAAMAACGFREDDGPAPAAAPEPVHSRRRASRRTAPSPAADSIRKP